MQLIIQPNGSVRCIYNEAIDLAQLGAVKITRGSHVEPDTDGQWLVDLSPVDGPLLGPFRYRSDALQAEVAWLTRHWLSS